MGAKRKSAESRNDEHPRPEKKAKQVPVITKAREERGKREGQTLLFTARPDWHAAELPALPDIDIETQPPQRAIDELHTYANTLLEAENAAYNASHLAGSSSHKFLSTIMASGTLEDKVSALTLLVQESPLHTMKAFENLLGLAKKKSRNQALMAVAALKDLLGQGVVLPNSRKLKAFSKQPGLLGALQGKAMGGSLPGSLQKIHLLVWAYEDWLKKMYFDLLHTLEHWCSDEVEYSRSRAITYVYELLKDKPEQEENLLRLLVNKLGDTDRKIASRASYLLLQLENTHPAMKLIVTNSVEADCLFRPGQSLHARYYAIITLNQTILSQKEEQVANRLLDIYFSLFVQLLKPLDKTAPKQPILPKNPLQGGGGKPGKLAAKKRKAEEKKDDTDDQLREKMIAQVLTGVNRAFPFADTNDPQFERQMDTLFRVTHSANFNTSIQALMLLQQISSTKHYGAERYYRTLYESLLDPRLVGSSKQVMYLNLLYKSLKADLSAKRVQAFVKRLLQTITMHDPPFVCGVLYLISELEGTFPALRTMMSEGEVADEDEEERFVDVPEDGDASLSQLSAPAHTKTHSYDARKRDPEHAHAERSSLWDLLPFLAHFHPSVSLFAESLLLQKAMPPKPDPTKHTLMHFLDRFVYRAGKSKPAAPHGSSIMQPLAGGSSQAADLLVRPGDGRVGVPVNSEAFWRKKVGDVAADEVFFHSYFAQTTSGKKRKVGGDEASKKDKKLAKRDVDGSDDDEEDEDAGEDEIWKAIANSRPDVEGDDEDDDLSLGDLESAYSDSEDEGSEPGLDLGGGDDDKDDAEEANFDEMDGLLPELESGDEDAMWDDEDDVPDVGLDEEEEEKAEETELTGRKKQRAAKKKLKALPTFASMEDYARLIDAEPDDM